MLDHMLALKDEIEILKTKIKPSCTGHIHTTISTLENRVKEITEELKNKYVERK
jgi:hypothetical protein